MLVDLPSAGAHPGHVDNSQDVGAIRTIITNLANDGKEVLLVMHSGGGIPGSLAVEGLGIKDRKAEGKKGGVVRVFYIGLLLPELGKSIFETFMTVLTGADLDPDFVVDSNQAYHVVAEVRLIIQRITSAVDDDQGWNFNYCRR